MLKTNMLNNHNISSTIIQFNIPHYISSLLLSREAPFWNVLFPHGHCLKGGEGGVKACQDGFEHFFFSTFARLTERGGEALKLFGQCPYKTNIFQKGASLILHQSLSELIHSCFRGCLASSSWKSSAAMHNISWHLVDTACTRRHRPVNTFTNGIISYRFLESSLTMSVTKV